MVGLIFQKQDLNLSGVQNRAGEASTGTVCLQVTRINSQDALKMLHPGHNSVAGTALQANHQRWKYGVLSTSSTCVAVRIVGAAHQTEAVQLR